MLPTQALRTAIGDSGATIILLEMSPVDDTGDPLGFSRYQMDLHMMAMCVGPPRRVPHAWMSPSPCRAALHTCAKRQTKVTHPLP